MNRTSDTLKSTKLAPKRDNNKSTMVETRITLYATGIQYFESATKKNPKKTKRQIFQLFIQAILIFTEGKQLTMEKIYPNKQKQPPLPSVRCFHSFCRRRCSISQGGSKGVRGLCHIKEAKTPKHGQPEKQTPVPRESPAEISQVQDTQCQGFRPDCHWNSIPWRLYHLHCLY